MSISTEEKYYLNNKMGTVANKVQLGTLIENAESIVAAEIALADGSILVGNASGIAAAQAVSGDITLSNAGVAAIAGGVIVNADVNAAAAIAFSKLAALPSAQVLVGSAGNVATAVALSGDVTVGNTGVTAIGAGKVTEAMIADPSAAALNVKRTCLGVFDATAGKATAAFDISAALPDNAIVQKVDYEVITTFTSATDAATIALSVEGAGDIIAAVAISDGANPWDAGVPKVTLIDGTTAEWVKLSAAKALVATVAVEALTAGVLRLYADYVESV